MSWRRLSSSPIAWPVLKGAATSLTLAAMLLYSILTSIQGVFMKLEQYITDLCAKLRSGDDVKLAALTDMPYRHLIASVLTQHLTGPATVVVESLLGEVIKVQESYFACCKEIAGLTNYKEAHQASLKELEAITASKLIEATPIKAKPKPKEKLTLKSAVNSVAKDTAKPKRVIQLAPKAATEQDKLDAAMQGLRKRRAEKKAAQKAKKDE